MAQRNLYALLIGIDKYKHVGNLGGCKADISKVKEFFGTLASGEFGFHARTLFDEDATKKGIISAFYEHLVEQAKEGDVALLYYSGHGAQEDAAEVFWKSEPDKKLEGLVCHDSGRGGATLLADQELRYLIHELSRTKCEILTIFDSCHSADNTRSSQASVSASFPQRRIATVMPKRKWSEFIFSDKFSQEELAAKGMATLLPQGRHVQMAACKDSEFAYENNNGGMFTDGLLKALRESSGKISYLDLLSKVKYSIKGEKNGVTQSPQSYYTFGHEEDVFKEFLSGAVRDRPLYANIVYNAKRKEWILDKGAIHGVGRKIEGGEQVVLVPIEGGKNISADIQQVDSSSCVLRFSRAHLEDVLDTEKTYQGILKGLLVEPLSLYVDGNEQGAASLKQYVDNQKTQWQDWTLFLVDSPDQATFQILAGGGIDDIREHYAITEVGSNIPLMEQSMGFDEHSHKDLETKLKVLSRWYYAKVFTNPADTLLGKNPIKLTVIQHDQELSHKENVFVIHYDDPSEPRPITYVKFQFTNTLDRALYMAGIYMDRDLGMMNNAIEQQVVELQPGASAWFVGGNALGLGWEDEKERDLIAYGVEHDYFMIKVIISTEEFSVDLFSQKGIPRAKTPSELTTGFRGSHQQRSLFIREAREPADPHSWTTQLFTFLSPNPRLNKA
ncbi:MAG: caspase family protein [Bacteroidota bacterium]